jgi:hypothetical protein
VTIMTTTELSIWVRMNSIMDFFKPEFITSLRGCGHINPDGYIGKKGGNQIFAKWMQSPKPLLKIGFSDQLI